MVSAAAPAAVSVNSTNARKILFIVFALSRQFKKRYVSCRNKRDDRARVAHAPSRWNCDGGHGRGTSGDRGRRLMRGLQGPDNSTATARRNKPRRTSGSAGLVSKGQTCGVA